MSGKDYLKGKRILIVDDEADTLETLEDLLSGCEVVKAANFEDAKKMLEDQFFDMAVLDIMGVDGYRLLEIAKTRDVIAAMLTANALSTEDTVKSIKEGAASYIPKEEMANITTYLNDILEAKEMGKNFWHRWLDRFADYYSRKFSSNWQDSNMEFWAHFPYSYYM